MIDYLPIVEIVQECPQYILEHSRCMGINSYYLYLIKDNDTGKYNVYVLDDEIKNWYKVADFIVYMCEKIPIEYAKYCFPEYGFTEEFYGF